MAESDASQASRRKVEGEAALVRGLRSHEPEACSEFYDRFASRIHRFAASLLPGDAELAEEMVVQTLADAVRDVARFNPRRSTLSAWLYGIARRRIQAELRRRKRLKAVPESAQIPLESIAEQPDAQDMASSLAARLDAQRTVAALTGMLSTLEMEVLTLHCVDEMSLKEIGQAVGRSERAVHSLLCRARSKARERLAPDER